MCEHAFCTEVCSSLKRTSVLPVQYSTPRKTETDKSAYQHLRKINSKNILRQKRLMTESRMKILDTYSTNKAGVMPGVTKGLHESVSSFNGKLTAMTASPKQTVEVFSQQENMFYILNTQHL